MESTLFKNTAVSFAISEGVNTVKMLL